MAFSFSLPNFGLGCGPFGRTEGVSGVASDAEAERIVHHCLAHGITFFDSAPLYGSGLSERRLGKALAGIPRQNFQIGSKIGVVINRDGSSERTYRREALKRSISESLERLHLDFLEIAHIHDADSDENYRSLTDSLSHSNPQFVHVPLISIITTGRNL